MIRMILLLVFFCLSINQDPLVYEFNFNRGHYSFRLPDLPYTLNAQDYVEGRFTTFKFSNGAKLVLHVGDDVVKPLLRSKNYKVTDNKIIDGVSIRKGCNRDSGLFWQENTREDGVITLYFEDVQQSELDIFERSLESLTRK
jgi:hypothetical protein